MRRFVRSVAVPLSGFLTLSAVSWQARSPRPCFMPLPPVGFVPTEPSSSPGSRTPLGAAGFPAGPPPPYLRCDARGRVLRVSPTPTPCGAVAWIPTGARTPFPPLASQRLPRRPGPHAPDSPRSGGFVRFEALFPPRGRGSRRSGFPVTPPPMAPLGVPPLQSLAPVEPRVLHSTRRTIPSAAQLAPR
jgi:hypothetical protein